MQQQSLGEATVGGGCLNGNGLPTALAQAHQEIGPEGRGHIGVDLEGPVQLRLGQQLEAPCCLSLTRATKAQVLAFLNHSRCHRGVLAWFWGPPRTPRHTATQTSRTHMMPLVGETLFSLEC